MFRNRIHAGMLLARKLKKFKNTGAVILAIPRGGVPVAYIIATKLNCHMELILSKKIGHPANKEYAIGAASLTDHFIIPHTKVTANYITQEIANVRARLVEMQDRFLLYKKENLTGKVILLVDDGIATGNTLLSTVQLISKNNPSKVIIAVPVASRSAVIMLSNFVDEIIVLNIPSQFYGVGAFYSDFTQVTDEEVIFYLDKM